MEYVELKEEDSLLTPPQPRPTLLQRALILFHMWGSVVYFYDHPSLRKTLCLQLEYLARDTLAQLLNPRYNRQSRVSSLAGSTGSYTSTSSAGSTLVSTPRRSAYTQTVAAASVASIGGSQGVTIPGMLPHRNLRTIWQVEVIGFVSG